MKAITGASRLGLLLVWCLLCWNSYAHAWHATGHALIGQIAYDNLSKGERKAFIELLEKHPRFEKDFVDRMPAAIDGSSSSSKEQWLFRQSGSWPDKARTYRGKLRRRFHQARWHYINYPLRIRRGGKLLGTIPETDKRPDLSSDLNGKYSASPYPSLPG